MHGGLAREVLPTHDGYVNVSWRYFNRVTAATRHFSGDHRAASRSTFAWFHSIDRSTFPREIRRAERKEKYHEGDESEDFRFAASFCRRYHVIRETPASIHGFGATGRPGLRLARSVAFAIATFAFSNLARLFFGSAMSAVSGLPANAGLVDATNRMAMIQQ